VARSAKTSDNPRQKGALRPILLAAGLGLYWFVQYQDAGADIDGPLTACLIIGGARLLADFVGAWFALSVLQLAFALARFGVTYVRSLWPQASQ
jgi:hypothetical protein